MSKNRRTSYGKDKTVGYGWVARWRDDETLGWLLPEHLPPWNSQPRPTNYNAGTKLVLCRITVEVVKRSDGKSIGRILKDEQ